MTRAELLKERDELTYQYWKVASKTRAAYQKKREAYRTYLSALKTENNLRERILKIDEVLK